MVKGQIGREVVIFRSCLIADICACLLLEEEELDEVVVDMQEQLLLDDPDLIGLASLLDLVLHRRVEVVLESAQNTPFNVTIVLDIQAGDLPGEGVSPGDAIGELLAQGAKSDSAILGVVKLDEEILLEVALDYEDSRKLVV